MTSTYLSTDKKRAPKTPPPPDEAVTAFVLGADVWWCVSARKKVWGRVVGYGTHRVRVSVDGQNRETWVDPSNLRVSTHR